MGLRNWRRPAEKSAQPAPFLLSLFQKTLLLNQDNWVQSERQWDTALLFSDVALLLTLLSRYIGFAELGDIYAQNQKRCS